MFIRLWYGSYCGVPCFVNIECEGVLDKVNSVFPPWLQRFLPTREALERNRFSRPFTQRPELFRLTRRSVPRGVAIGLLVGILAMLPGVQALGAALICLSVRGNIPIAIASTLISNPATAPFIIVASFYVGNALGVQADLNLFMLLHQNGASLKEWVVWMMSDAAPAIVLGLFVLSVVTSSIGYVVTSFIWREVVARKRRQRRETGKKLIPAE